MQKEKIDEWAFLRKPSGQIAYCPKCLGCVKDCKQSFRATVVFCPNYRKRGRKYKVDLKAAGYKFVKR